MEYSFMIVLFFYLSKGFEYFFHHFCSISRSKAIYVADMRIFGDPTRRYRIQYDRDCLIFKLLNLIKIHNKTQWL